MLEDLDNCGLSAGQVRTIIEVYKPTVFERESSDIWEKYYAFEISCSYCIAAFLPSRLCVKRQPLALSLSALALGSEDYCGGDRNHLTL